MEFKTQVSEFENFLDRIKGRGKNLKGEDTIIADDALIQVTDKGIKARVMKESQAIIATVKTKVEEVNETGKLPVGSIENFKDYLNRFNASDEVIIKTEEHGEVGSRVVIKRTNPKKMAKIHATDESAIESHVPEDDPIVAEKFVLHRDFDEDGELEEDVFKVNLGGDVKEHSVKAKFDAKQMSEVIEDGRVAGEREIPIKVTGNTIELDIGDDAIGGFETEVPAELRYEDGDVKGQTFKFAEGVENLFPNVDGKVEMYFVEQAPAYVVARTEDYRADYILSPVVE